MSYPSNIADFNATEFKKASNLASSNADANYTSVETIIGVDDATQLTTWPTANFVLYNATTQELLFCSSRTGNTLTVTRAYGGTTAAAITVGDELRVVWDAETLEFICTEIIAIETALGINFTTADFINKDGSVAFTGDQDMGGNKLTGLGAPSLDDDAATKSYVDGVIEGLNGKGLVSAVSDSNVASLSGTTTIDGVSLVANDVVLLTGQTAASENGSWVIQAGAWTRPDNFAAGSDASMAFWYADEGTAYVDTRWWCTTDSGSAVVDTNDLVITQFSGATEVTAGEGLSKTGNTLDLDINGLVEDAAPESGDFLTFYDSSEGVHNKVDYADLETEFGGGIQWSEVTGTTQAITPDSGYITNNASQVTLTLPATAAIGTVIEVIGKGAGGWKIAQNASQYIRWDEGATDGFNKTTTGTGGSMNSTDDHDAIELICTTADTIWTVQSAKGDINLV